MVISEINPELRNTPIYQNLQPDFSNIGSKDKFVDTLNEFVTDVNDLQKDSAKMVEKFIKGEAVDLHDVMIASEKAKTSFQLLVEIRNKFVDLYKEVGRIQV